MNGLLSQEQGAPAPAPQPAAPEQQAAQGASPEQEMYETVVGQSAVWLYENGMELVQNKLKSADDPADAIGDVVGNLLAMNVKGAGEQGKMIPPPIIVQGSMELIAVVMEIAVKGGFVPQEEAKQEAAESFYESMSVFGKAVGGSLDADSRNQYGQLVQRAIDSEQKYKGQQQPPAEPVPAQPGEV